MSENEAACGVTFSHGWHGYLGHDGWVHVCDGELLPATSAGVGTEAGDE